VDIGINFIDTARAYTDSEEKLGIALEGIRKNVIIATKTTAKDAQTLNEQLETSLSLLKTDYIDIYQLHNPDFIPLPGGADGLYDALLSAKQQGKIRFIGFTNHRINIAREAVKSGLYDIMQFPFSYLASELEIALVNDCARLNVGFICMKALSGGLITDVSAARAWLNQYNNVLPIWGLQRESEFEALKAAMESGDELTQSQIKKIEADKKQLVGNFFRGCGYCLPCPAGITINLAARASLFIRRAPLSQWIGWKDWMEKIEDCTHCGACAKRCPYGLNPQELLPVNLVDFREYYAKAVRC
jgi:predicted aldo/keto reductase-like oxidoreductase